MVAVLVERVAEAASFRLPGVLFDALKELKNSGTGAYDVAIELNPYVRSVNAEAVTRQAKTWKVRSKGARSKLK